MLKSLLGLVTVAFVFAAPVALAQGSVSQPSLAAEVLIFNPFNNSVMFYLECDDGDWTQFTLPAQSNSRYNCSGNATLYFSIKTDTGNGVVERQYKLTWGVRYQLGWVVQGQSGYYDLYVLTSGT